MEKGWVWRGRVTEEVVINNAIGRDWGKVGFGSWSGWQSTWGG